MFGFNRCASRYIAAAVVAAFTSILATQASAAMLNDPPLVRTETLRQIAPGVSVIPDPRINYVPNIGIIEGTRAILVVDTGMGAENGRRVYQKAKEIAKNRRIYLATTHFHPEHQFGASAFPKNGFIQSEAQAKENADKGEDYVKLFRSFGAVERDALRDVKLVRAGITYRGRKVIDLGGRKVIIEEMPGHTRGDQIIFEPSSGVIFTGDLVEDRFFPIMPDPDSSAKKWMIAADRIIAMKPRIVVPGHGDIGDIDLVRKLHDYLVQVHADVKTLVADGLDQSAIARKLSPVYRALHPDWDNAVFIPYEIAIFYAEATNRPASMPDLTQDLQSDASPKP